MQCVIPAGYLTSHRKGVQLSKCLPHTGHPISPPQSSPAIVPGRRYPGTLSKSIAMWRGVVVVDTVRNWKPPHSQADSLISPDAAPRTRLRESQPSLFQKQSRTSHGRRGNKPCGILHTPHATPIPPHPLPRLHQCFNLTPASQPAFVSHP